ncbi:hypothetical protein PUN28_000190 [Cardiocondyla obscurior]|uniref:Uncharacterized protein n=1 Tax=Cardiocondyla obscurior TaxID=286306 RepID=A0AAW2GYK4_9HYME
MTTEISFSRDWSLSLSLKSLQIRINDMVTRVRHLSHVASTFLNQLAVLISEVIISPRRTRLSRNSAALFIYDLTSSIILITTSQIIELDADSLPPLTRREYTCICHRRSCIDFAVLSRLVYPPALLPLPLFVTTE